MIGRPQLSGAIAGLTAGAAVATRLEHVDTVGGATIVVVAAGVAFGAVSTVVERSRAARRRRPPR